MSAAHIVLIEDDPADVFLIKMALDEGGIPYSMTEFRSGIEAVEAFCGHNDRAPLSPDAILMDLNTPRTDGFKALVQLRDAPPLVDVPIALLTSSRARSDKERARMQGVRYIEKPSDLREFLAVVGQTVKEMLAPGMNRLSSAG